MLCSTVACYTSQRGDRPIHRLFACVKKSTSLVISIDRRVRMALDVTTHVRVDSPPPPCTILVRILTTLPKQMRHQTSPRYHCLSYDPSDCFALRERPALMYQNSPLWHIDAQERVTLLPPRHRLGPHQQRHDTYNYTRHMHFKKQQSPPPPSVTSKSVARKIPVLCRAWLSGCQNGRECQYTHSLEELLAPLYTEETLCTIEQEEGRRLDRKRCIYLAREITTCHCANTDCSMRGNDHMRNKEIVLHTQTRWQPLPAYYSVTCKQCHVVMSPFHMSLYHYAGEAAVAALPATHR